MNVVTHFPLNINKRPLRHYGSTSIWLRLLSRDTLVDSRGNGLGSAGQGRAGQGSYGIYMGAGIFF